MFRLFFLAILIAATTQYSFGQLKGGKMSTQELTGEVNTITSAVPFLMIAPDSRSGGMGDAGVATSPDPNSQHWNPAKYAFIQKDMGLSVSYTPWLRHLIDDINLAYLSGFYRMSKNEVLSMSLLYFSLGNITFTDIVGNTIGQFNPNEFAVDGAYSRKFSNKISGGIALRYIYSNLTGGTPVGGVESHPGWSVAADISSYYQDDFELFKLPTRLSVGINISNIGAKISYTENADKDFIPTNLKLGAALKLDLDDYNSLMATVDLNKMMVPTQPKYYEDSVDENNDLVIQYGKDPEVSVPVGMFQSFYDAPGTLNSSGERSVFNEEIHEITYSAGLEYWYAKQFSIRAGYFNEHATKGNRKFFTVGLGLKLNVFGLDFAYLMPTSGQNNPLANTLRFTLLFDFEALKAEQSVEPAPQNL